MMFSWINKKDNDGRCRHGRTAFCHDCNISIRDIKAQNRYLKADNERLTDEVERLLVFGGAALAGGTDWMARAKKAEAKIKDLLARLDLCRCNETVVGGNKK